MRKGISLLLTPGKLSTENRLLRKHNQRPVSLQDDKRIWSKTVRQTIIAARQNSADAERSVSRV